MWIPEISVVIPVYNEKDSILPLFASLKVVLTDLKVSYEIIFVNDCSEDGSSEIFDNLGLKESNVVITSLNRHSGQSIAMQTGFDIARGKLVVTMDADLQNDPTDIPKLLYKMRDGYDVVCGWRYKRLDPWSKILASKIYFVISRVIFKERIHDPGCTLRVMKSDILKNIFLFKGAHRFLTLIVSRLGYKIGEEKIKHWERRYGKSKYNIRNRLFESVKVLLLFLLFDTRRLMIRKHD